MKQINQHRLTYLYCHIWCENVVFLGYLLLPPQNLPLSTIYICLTSLTRAKPKDKMEFPA